MKKISLLLYLFIVTSHSFSQLQVDPSFNPVDKGGGKHSGTFGKRSWISSSVILPDGKIIVSGNYTFMHNTLNCSLSKLNADGTLDESFKSPVYENGVYVNNMAGQKDGKIILTGQFTNLDGPFNYFVRIKQDGSRDNSFKVDINKIRLSSSGNPIINIQDDGKIILSNILKRLDKKHSAIRIVRLNNNGSIDTTFNPDITDPYENDADLTLITCSKLDKQGKLLVSGYFNTGNPAFKNFVRFNQDGSLDTTFKYAENDFAREITTFDIQDDGKIIFTVNGDIVRVNTNGSIDESFKKGHYDYGRTYNPIFSIKIQTDKKILIAGAFLNYNNSNRSRLIRLNQNGDVDETFNTGVGLGFDPLVEGTSVKNISLFEDGSILITGPFNYYDGIWQGCIAKLSANGSLNAEFNADNGKGADANINSVVLQNDNKAIIAGNFSYYNGKRKNKITRVNTDGTIDNTFNTGTGPDSCNYINTIAIQKDGKILAGGNFSSFNNKDQSFIVRLNIDGTVDDSFKFIARKKLYGDVTEGVKNIIIQPDGKIIINVRPIAHIGSSINGEIMRLNSDGQIDDSFSMGFSDNSWMYGYDIRTIALQADGKLMAGGYFEVYSPGSKRYYSLCRLNYNGSVDESFIASVPDISKVTGNIFHSTIDNIIVDTAGKIYAAGMIAQYADKQIRNFFRINPDGSLDESFQAKAETFLSNDATYLIKLDADNKVLFATYNGMVYGNSEKYFYSKISRCNTDGSLDSSFGTDNKGDFIISDMAVQKDGKIIVGGWLESFNDIKRNHIMRLTPPEVLPLQWVKVNAVRTGKSDVTVNWLTANEINVKKFVVLRSLSVQTFTEIATVNAGSHNYSFVDKNATLAGKTIYYKIQSTDVDGKISYSNVVSVHIDGKKEIFVSPNPATDHIDIITNLASSKKLNIAITDNNGFLIQKNVIQVADGYTKNSTRLDNFAKGIYYIHISGTGVDEVFKIVIQ